VSGMKDLAAQYRSSTSIVPACTATLAAGNATAAALFHYPDFFKVGIAESAQPR